VLLSRFLRRKKMKRNLATVVALVAPDPEQGCKSINGPLVQGGLMKRLRNAAMRTSSAQRHLNIYALVLGAVGFGLLALTPLVEAKIVYTPKNVNIVSNHSYNLDLNHDGVADFTISNSSAGQCPFSTVAEHPASGNSAIFQYIDVDEFAAALKGGAVIG